MFGAGMLPGAPGTWGSLATVIILYPVLRAAGPDSSLWETILAGGLVVFSVLAVVIGNYAVEDFGRKDPGPFVLDEAAGICLTLLFLPPRTGGGLLLTLAVAFAAFRLFDVTKPPPARQLEKLPGGWGILFDDLAAAVYANILCQIVLRGLAAWSS
jgi:phosphatidylglycerophosphatase A